MATTINVDVLLDEATDSVLDADLNDGVVYSTSVPVDAIRGVLNVDLTTAVRRAIQSGKTRLNLRISSPIERVRIDVYARDINGGFEGQSNWNPREADTRWRLLPDKEFSSTCIATQANESPSIDRCKNSQSLGGYLLDTSPHRVGFG